MSPLRRCAFSSSLLTRTAAATLRAIPHGVFSLVFPAECRICKNVALDELYPGTGLSRMPESSPGAA